MYCTKCGGQLTQGSKYCGSCGIRIIRTTSQYPGEPVITNSTLEPDPKKLAEQAAKEAEQLTNRRNTSPSVSHFQQDRNIQNTIDRTINRMFSQKEKNKWAKNWQQVKNNYNFNHPDCIWHPRHPYFGVRLIALIIGIGWIGTCIS